MIMYLAEPHMAPLSAGAIESIDLGGTDELSPSGPFGKGEVLRVVSPTSTPPTGLLCGGK